MLKYLLKRLLHGLISIIIVVAIVMVLVYSFMDRDAIFQKDNTYSKISENTKEEYKYRTWGKYGYIEYFSYGDYLQILVDDKEISSEQANELSKIGYDYDKDSEDVSQYVSKYRTYCSKKGYTVKRLKAKTISEFSDVLKTGGEPYLFAYKDINVFVRLWKYFTRIITIDNIHYADGEIDGRGISFTFFDPAYGGKVFSPAIIGNGTKHKFLLYFDNHFPFIHQNLISVNLGTSYSVNQGVDIMTTMTETQGSMQYGDVTYPTGYTEYSTDDLHTLQYVKNSNSSDYTATRFTDDYTYVVSRKSGMSRIGYSFVIGLLATILSYLVGVPLGILMAHRKDKIADKIGTIYIVFIMAVPSLAYIFMFRELGVNLFGLPRLFDTVASPVVYILPIVSLALPTIANLMKWLRRYMIDQMNSDYVKFARSGGLSEGEIFRKHILKNAAIPLIHGIPGSILGCLTGAIITESVYLVPGTGDLLVRAIDNYDNSVIIGVALFYAVLSVVSLILGDILMALADPRISFNTKGR